MLRSYFLLASCCLLFAYSVSAGAENYNDGLVHYEAGDYAKAYCIWSQLAEKNHVAAQYSLGWMYANGEGLAVNAKEGIKWWRKSAALGHPDAHFAMALAYTTGEGVKKNALKAIEWHIDASQLGHEDSQSILYDLIVGKFNKLERAQQELLQEAWRMLGTSNFIDTKVANVRRGPGKKYRVIASLKAGDEIVEFQKKNGWVQIGVLRKRKVGWVHQSLIP